MNSLARKFPLSILMLSMLLPSVYVNAATTAPTKGLLKDELARKIIYATSLNTAPDGASEIKVSFDGFPLKPTITLNEVTKRMMLDFGEIEFKVASPQLTPTPQVKGFYLARNELNHTIMVVDLDKNGRFTTKSEAGNFILRIYPDPATLSKQAPVVTNTVISELRFNRTKAGDDVVVVTLPSTNTSVETKQEVDKVIIRFKNTMLSPALLKARYFNDSRAVLASTKSYHQNGDAVIEFVPTGNFTYMASQDGNKLALKFTPVARPVSTKTSATPQKFTGRKVSLDFQNVETKRILQLLSSYTGTNIVTSDLVTGTISLKLTDVPWDQALAVILKTNNLEQRREGDVIWVAPAAEVAKQQEAEARAFAQSVDLAPLETTFIQLNYAVAADVVTLIKATAQKTNASGDAAKSIDGNRQLQRDRFDANGENSTSLLSPRGTISFDARTNTIILNDTAKKLSEIKHIVSQIDIPVKQVMVEAKIVHASTDFAKALGVKWGVQRNKGLLLSNNTTNLNNLYRKDNGITGGSAGSGGSIGGGTGSGTGSSSGSNSASNNVNLDLGAAVAAIGTSNLAFGLINTTSTLLSLELAALQSDGRGEVLSAPKVMTGDKQPAMIRSGAKIPYQTTTENSGTTTTFQDAVLELSVTPSITPDGNVQMKLSIHKDTLGISTSAGYVIDTNTLETNVLVGNGETVVLGGFYENSRINGVTRVPFLGDLPGVGGLFRNKSNEDKKQELLIFITPKIIAEATALAQSN